MAEFVSLGTAWSNKGFVGINKDYLQVLQVAFNARSPIPSEPSSQTAEEAYRERLADWSSGGVTHSRKAVRDLSVLKPLACNRLFVISNITFDPDDQAEVQIAPTDVCWRWEYYPFAFAIKWGLGYHLTNQELRKEEQTFRRLVGLARKVHPELREGTLAWRAFLLALYERVLGMQYDAKKVLPHYENNILYREGMESDHLRVRPELFRDYLAYCKVVIERGLLS